MSRFLLKSNFEPTGDQPHAIEQLVANFRAQNLRQTLLGVTGSGKTFTMANMISRLQKPALVISPNKTLAAQLYEEFKDFFPDAAVHYFVSYYDYYQPEAYLPRTDTYIEKDAKINDLIDALRHASTASLLTRKDVIIVASVSCIYGVGNPEAYQNASIELKVGEKTSLKELAGQLTLLRYVRNAIDPRQGHFRVRENTVEIYLPSGEEIIQIELEKNKIVSLKRNKAAFSPRDTSSELAQVRLFPAKHFVAPEASIPIAIENIKKELHEQLTFFKTKGKVLEAARLGQRTKFDLEMLQSTGYVNGIENYSRHLDFRESGTPPHTLIDYFKYANEDDFLTFIDESHVAVPQIRGMYFGDRARKQTLVDYGFRLPSALDNRPLSFEEFNEKIKQITYVSATPSFYEIKESTPCLVEQMIRPTGIVDPELEMRPTREQIKDVIAEIKKRTKKGERSLVMALTKRLAEDIAEYLTEAGIKTDYLHSEVKTLDRPKTLRKLRTGEFEALVGINLLREGIDLPEVSFIAILDADKEGFLRNETTLLQIIGRAARHPNGKVILYADTLTGSMKAAMHETDRRRKIQAAHNKLHGIIPTQIQKEIRESLLESTKEKNDLTPSQGGTRQIIASLEQQMKKAAREMDFELAAKLRDRIAQYHSE